MNAPMSPRYSVINRPPDHDIRPAPECQAPAGCARLQRHPRKPDARSGPKSDRRVIRICYSETAPSSGQCSSTVFGDKPKTTGAAARCPYSANVASAREVASLITRVSAAGTPSRRMVANLYSRWSIFALSFVVLFGITPSPVMHGPMPQRPHRVALSACGWRPTLASAACLERVVFHCLRPHATRLPRNDP
jgi:hypothetical protein